MTIQKQRVTRKTQKPRQVFKPTSPLVQDLLKISAAVPDSELRRQPRDVASKVDDYLFSASKED